MNAAAKFVSELRRRRVLTNAALYIAAAWVTIQVAGEAIDAGVIRIVQRDVFVAAFIGFPIALIVSWFYDITRKGLVRTPPAGADDSYDTSLHARDYGILAALVVVWALGVYIVHTPPAVERSIAILPFENRNLDPENEAFAYGIRVDLQTQLQKIHDVTIIARESSDKVDADLAPSLIGQSLGAAYIMKGTVERALERVRISVILVDAVSETQAFAATYDRDLSARNWFDIRNEISDSIVRTLRATLSPDELQNIRTEPTQNLAAMNAYGQGMRNKEKRIIASLADAMENFQTAIDLDPEFALAYVGYADSLYLHQLYSFLPLEEILPDMKAAVDRALAIDDSLGEAWVSRAVIERVENGDTPAAETYHTRAIELSPNYFVAHQWYGAFLESTDRPELGLASMQRARLLNPQSAHLAMEVGVALMNLGRDDEAFEQFEAGVELDPAVPGPYERIAELHAAYGRMDEAVIWQRRGADRDPDDMFSRIWLTIWYLELGDLDRAERWIEHASRLAPPGTPFAESLYEPLSLRRGDLEGAAVNARNYIEFNPQGRYSLITLREIDFRNGQYGEALARYESTFPDLFADPLPPADQFNYEIAIDIAPILLRMGQAERANELLDRSLEALGADESQSGPGAPEIRQVTIYALKGETETALDLLEETMDGGWIGAWWHHFYIDSSLDSIRGTARFQAVVQQIEGEMAAQRARLEEMEANGQLAPIPEIGE